MSDTDDSQQFGTLRLVIVEGQRVGDKIVLAESKTTIGRTTGDVTIDDPEVSSLHCELTRDGERLLVKDLGSTNGTWIDGQRVTDSELRPGRILRLGRTSFKLDLPDTEVAVDARGGATWADPQSSSRLSALSDLVTATAFVLTGVAGAAESLQVQLPLGRLIIGRGEGQIRLEDPKISRKHAEIDVRGGKVHLRDLASINGTRLNGVPVRTAVLRPGDVVGIGDCELRLDLLA